MLFLAVLTEEQLMTEKNNLFEKCSLNNNEIKQSTTLKLKTYIIMAMIKMLSNIAELKKSKYESYG